MVVSKDHIIAVAMDKVLPRPTAATREITQHYMETVSIKRLTFEDPVMEKHVMFPPLARDADAPQTAPSARTTRRTSS